MKIAIMSDSHENWQNLQAAVKTANEAGCELLLFNGDLIAPTKLEFLGEFKGRVVFTWGNNDGEKHRLLLVGQKLNIEFAGGYYEDTVDGVRIFVNHYPRYSQLAAKTGEFDLCVYGHDHVYFDEMVGNCLLINPGALEGFQEPASFVIYDTSTKTFEKITL